MDVRNWSLIIFTLLSQMSVGSFFVLGVVHYFAVRKAGNEEADRLSDRALMGIIPVMILAMLATFFHLGDVLNAYRAVVNFGSSWLSREILFGSIFTVLAVIFMFMQWKKVSSAGVRNGIAFITALIGFALVYSMSNVYLLESQPVWNTLATPISFFTTTLLLGGLAMGAAFVANYGYVQKNIPDCADAQCELLRSALRWIAIAAVVLLGVELVVIPLNMAFLATGPEEGITSMKLLWSEYSVIFSLRLILAFLGAGVFSVFVYQNALSPGKEKILGNYAYAAFAIMLVAEVLSRFLFYATEVQVGI